MKKLLALFTIFLVLTIYSCSTVPITGRSQFAPLPASQMLALGEQSYDQVLAQSQLSTNKAQTEMVRRVGRRIARAVENYFKANGMEEEMRGFDWEFNLIASDQKNAWAMPGGKVAFYEGILPICQDENGIAVVMGHEIAHAIAQHGNERMGQELAVQLGGMTLMTALSKKPEATQQLALTAFGLGSQIGIMLPYSRAHESEADEMGLYFMAMAGYDPNEAPEFWKRMNAGTGQESRPPEFLSTHPSPETRINKLKRLIPKALKYQEVY
ncbi:M48 family metallopeptidase [Flexithrix dorotheae]|uniref:M48 family metallopeptidase n=1 Tax=Flexithrix dorotheae TaxID=70993 RepID=UPI0003737584|nr:M48 family metallopeptidase [Flexithrix dorotheae]